MSEQMEIGSKVWAHDELAADLAAHLKAPERMVWIDMQLGSMHSPRPDVYAINKSYTRPCPTAYECKISVSDFRADVTTGKWSKYLSFAHSVVFAVPAGLVSKADVPEQCGLIVRHENVWRFAKKATVNPRPIDQEALLKLLIDGVHREGPAVRAKRWNDWDVTRKFAERFGVEAARYVSDAASVHQTIERAQHNAENILDRARRDAEEIKKRAEQEAPRLWAELLQVLGLEADASRWSVEAEVRRLRNEAGGPEAAALRQTIGVLRRIVQNNEHLVKEPE